MNPEIELISDQDNTWRDLYTKIDTTHFFQSPDWARLLTSHMPTMESAHIKMRWQNKTYVIPMIRNKKLGGLFSTFMSLPLGTTGGIIGENEIDTALIPYLIKYLKSKKPLKIVISCQNDRIKELLEPYGSIDKISSLTLTLDRPYERIESELFSRNKRKLVNRGRRRGVIISRKKDSSTIDAYCSLQKKVEGQKGWATPFPEAFTRDMISLKEADLWTAWLDNKLTCAIVSFSYHKTATAWQGILDRDLKESLSAQPMNLLYASMIQYYQENRCDVFDMGYSLGIPSLELYKRGFGCKETPMYYFTWKSRLFKMLSFIKTVINYLKINRTKPASPLSQNSSDDTD